MKTYFVKGLKASAWVLIGVGYMVATYYGAKVLGYTIGKKLLN